MSNQGVQDGRHELAHLKRHLVATMGDEQRLYQRYSEAVREADRWKRRAELAVSKGEDDLARSALERSATDAGRAAEYNRQYLEQKGHVEWMKARLLELRAWGGIRPIPPTSAPAAERAAARWSVVEERVQEERARLVAFAELERDDLAEKLAALERDDRLDRQLAEVKARLKELGKGSV